MYISNLQCMLFYQFCRVDIVLVSGDIANVPADCYGKGPQEVFDENQRELEKIVNEFTSVASRVYYVPGNVRYILYS